MTSYDIHQNLLKRFKRSKIAFNSIPSKESVFDELYVALEQYNYAQFKENLEQEILTNLKEWWINTEQGIIPSEELYAILFEYDYYLAKNVEATSYGIGTWKNYKVHYDLFNMGSEYDFTTEFYAAPGMTLTFFDPLEVLDSITLEDEDIEDTAGYDEIIDMYKLKGMIAIHEVLVKLDAEGVFEVLNYKDNFMFIIDEHDSGEVYPLLIKNNPMKSALGEGKQIQQDNLRVEHSQIDPELPHTTGNAWWQFWK